MKVAVIGGTREADLLEDRLKAAGVVLDPGSEIAIVAAHPFDTDLWDCAALSVAGKAHIGLVRPSWHPEIDDHWHMASTAEQAAEALATSRAKRALLAVGNSRLAPFYRIKGIELCVRSRNAPHPPTPPHGLIRVMKGPFNVESEMAEMQAQRIDALVAHNAGGDGGWPKLLAARKLGIPVILIKRPTLPKMDVVETVDDAVRWAMRHMGLDG